MDRKRAALLASLLFLGGGLFLFTRRAAASSWSEEPPPWIQDILAAVDEAGTVADRIIGGAGFSTDAAAVSVEGNLAAFLQAIRAAEGTADGNGYYRSFGVDQFFLELDTHPAIRTYGEWLKPGVQDFTTAAGAYQITFTTWKRLAAKLGLADFGQETQDAMAIELIREAGALADVIAGRFAAAVRKVSGIWASLPFATANQKRRSEEFVRQAYVNAGGAVA